MRHQAIREGSKVRLRPFERADIETYRVWINDPEIMAQADRAGPVTAEEHSLWYERLMEADSTFVFAVENRETGTYLGNVWLYAIEPRHRRAEVRIILGAPGTQNRGFGTEALRLLKEYAFRSLGMEKLYAYVLTSNPRARQAFLRAGFADEALLRQDRIARGKRIDVWLLAAWVG